jgi:tetratricopeptide (TPR) repeat protein
VPVSLDGHQIKAIIDTGATSTALRKDKAEQLFGLSMGSAEAPENGTLNGETGLKTYRHRFKSLSFGTVSIENAVLTIIPNAMNRNIDPRPLVADRAKTERDLVNEPELILGMDILRRLRLYFAFREEKLYVSPSVTPAGGVQPYTPDFLAAMLKRLDELIAAAPNDAADLNDRCFWRAIAKSELESALADCDKSLTLEPGKAQTLDSRAFVLYQQGKYDEALAAYDLALQSDPNQAPSLLMRGLTKGKLGDETGKQADIALAKKDDPNIEAEFKRIGIEDKNL